MERLHTSPLISSASLVGAWWTPRLMRCAVVLALLLPGSFAILPLIWLWHRRNGGRTS